MKDPEALRIRLRRQWQDHATRAARLLDPGQWPLRLAIGRPAAAAVSRDPAALRAHIDAWRQIATGSVGWRAVRYRSLAAPVEVPVEWVLDSPAQWVEAADDPALRREYRLMAAALEAVSPRYHPLLVRQRQWLASRGLEEVVQACRVADRLHPGYAAGRPLRALSVAGCDSKFFERNRPLLERLLGLRFGAEASAGGLEAFLGAADGGEHWLLVAPLGPRLLPFEQLRLRAGELHRRSLPGSHLLVVENERALYQLPALPDTVAVLGAGLDLGWLEAEWIRERVVGYWGDLDTWGLSMLAAARLAQPHLTALLMDRATFDAYAPAHAVAEPVKADPQPPTGLAPPEQALYRHLHGASRGRLEQEFVPAQRVREACLGWRGAAADTMLANGSGLGAGP